jgi:Domain of unknown function (DUF4062)
MPHQNSSEPRHYMGVMISSTFTDLQRHREVLIEALGRADLKAIAMENDSAKPMDMITSSLQMVRDCSAYIALIGHKYGQVPVSPSQNPERRSVTELEFEEAQKLGRPILLFIMSEAHTLTKADVETNKAREKKLNAFRNRAKRMNPNSTIHRVYATFDSLEDFRAKVIQAVAALEHYILERQSITVIQPEADAPSGPPLARETKSIPKPPALYAEPYYLGSHQFVGRQAQLDTLSDWASASEPHPVLLFDAIGGTGKSMLAWEWLTRHAPRIRTDWGGQFWYSFYERGATMSDFCQRALAYVTEKPLKNFRAKRTTELSEMLLMRMRERPYLFILDGLERVLVAYHRIDAAQVSDEEVNNPTDQIADRDPCTAIRPEDDDLLLALSASTPSKLLITSRLVPRVLLNRAGQTLPGVLRVSLPGLRPSDAEELLRSCGVTGDSEAIQNYLKTNCDCHPLVTGVLAGLINDYLPDRGNFDTWLQDLQGGGQLKLSELDLVQKRNHILKTGLTALSIDSYQLLSMLALLSEGVDYTTLSALNPYLPSEPKQYSEPDNPETIGWWENGAVEEKQEERWRYERDLERRKKYEEELEAYQHSISFTSARKRLEVATRDLERRGLLQYDRQSKRYDLHPVVRATAIGSLAQPEKERNAQRVVDYFSQQAHNPYEDAETLDDLRNALHVTRALLQLGRYRQACDSYLGVTCNILLFKLEAYAEVLSIERPFFRDGWDRLPEDVSDTDATHLAHDAACALSATGAYKQALSLKCAMLSRVFQDEHPSVAELSVASITLELRDLNRLAKSDQLICRAFELDSLIGHHRHLRTIRVGRFKQLALDGRLAEAEELLKVLLGDSSPDRDDKASEEAAYVVFHFYRGTLTEEMLRRAENLAREDKSRGIIRGLLYYRASWHFDQEQWAQAAESLNEAVRMARQVGQVDSSSEALLARARFRLGQLPDPHSEAERLSNMRHADDRMVAELWYDIGNHEHAYKHALASHKYNWADGPIFARRNGLQKARELIQKLGAEPPDLPPYDPTRDPRLPFEDELEALISRLRAQKVADPNAGLSPLRLQ